MPNNNNNNATHKEYLQHNRYCRTFGQTSPKHMEQVIAFVFASIRTQTFLLPKLMKEWRKRGVKSSWIWGNKKNGIAYIRKNRTDLYNRMMSIIKAKKSNMSHDLIMLFLGSAWAWHTKKCICRPVVNWYVRMHGCPQHTKVPP